MIDVQDVINTAIERNSAARSYGRHKRDLKFYVSDAGTCYRKRYFRRMGVEREDTIPVGALRKMFAGDAAHSHLQSLLGGHGKLMAAEGTVEDDHIKGHFDAIIQHEDQKAVIDFKTIEKWGMSHVKGTCKCPQKNEPGHVGPKREHLLQLFTYWYFLRRDYRNLDQAIIFYMKREDFEGVPFDYLWSQDIEAQVKAEWAPLIEYWVKKEVPPCTCHQDYGGNGVKYCLYANEEKTECCSLELLKEFEAKQEIPA